MKKFHNWRVYLILVLILLPWAGCIARLFFLQVLNYKFYKAEALGQQVSFNDISGPRGQIFAENSQSSKGSESSDELKSFAINKNEWTISVNPTDIKDKLGFADGLSKVTDLSKDKILAQLNAGGTYTILEKDLSDSSLQKIKDSKIKNITWQNEPSRFYPQGNLAAPVIGFLGGEGSGQYGLEGYYNDILKGKSGIEESGQGIGSFFSGDKNVPLDGSDIYLTIDYNIQFQAEALLKQTQKNLGISAGQIIVMKPDTGKILAMANYPSFDPNNYSKVKDLDIFQNGATQKLFEPGSIMKSFTMAMGLNEGKITPDTTYVDTGAVKVGIETLHNFNNEKMGEQTMTGVLENSLNTGAVFVEQKIPNKTFFDYINRFGFLEKTGVDLQAEAYSQNSLLKNGPDVEFATASFGQGIELTPLQIARGYCALANGGKLVKPYVVDKIVNGSDVSYTKPEISAPILSQSTLSQLNTMLIDVVDKGFHGVAKIPGYYLGGKTGTAQIPSPGGGYLPDSNTIQSFVGYGPVYNPQFLIMVKLDNPKVPKSALSAVPVFKQLAQYIINYWQIPPDYDPTDKTK